MPTARLTRRIAAPPEQLWEVVCDPHHLPRWWPRVTRVEDVYDGSFTEVMKTRKGKTVRADFTIVESDASERRVRWDQRIEGTPFAGVLAASETELRLSAIGESGQVTPAPEGGVAAECEVTIEMRQTLNQQSTQPRSRLVRAILPTAGSGGLGGRLVRRAAQQTIGEALDGLERISV